MDVLPCLVLFLGNVFSFAAAGVMLFALALSKTAASAIH